jgi:hypothetical protein
MTSRTPAELAVLPVLKHVDVGPRDAKGCICPQDSWAPCGGQYEGRYSPMCSLHRRLPGSPVSHYPGSCPKAR